MICNVLCEWYALCLATEIAVAIMWLLFGNLVFVRGAPSLFFSSPPGPPSSPGKLLSPLPAALRYLVRKRASTIAVSKSALCNI
jgi:hypothetical protein